jgi:flagellar hook-associated protein 3 FlgL
VYSGDTLVQSVTTPAGQAIPVSLVGSTVFGAALSALNQLVADLATGATGTTTSAVTSTTIGTDAATLSSALTQLTSQRTVLGNSLSRIEATSTYSQTQEANLKIQQSDLVSADTAQVATDLSASETQHQALLNVIAALGKNNLFDYIQ